ncbi:hypothetical protein DFJ77DRAFT_461785 [Powellomyces hirtus]|nr:hypothetical protein DFJ77DRAFT_461785 [Powellomyces hirtus]
MDRPARKQVNAPAKATVNVEQGGNFNIWYNRWSGEGRKHKALEKAERRCNMKRDMGYTKAQPGSLFCVHFSRGCCMKGEECQYWHRAPIPEDREDQTHDCFGRERFREDREDMGGVGSFERDNRTLYVGNIKAPTSEMEEIVRRHFGDWGEIEHINILFSKNVAFVRYVKRYNAEFAREAMYGQSLDSNEILNVRWATEDPNPRVKDMKKRKVEEHISDTVQKNLPQIGDMGTILDYENYYSESGAIEVPPAKAAKVEESETFAFLKDASNAAYGEDSTTQAADGSYNGWMWDGIGWRYVGEAGAAQQQAYTDGAATGEQAAYDEEAYRNWYYAQAAQADENGSHATAEAPAEAPVDTESSTATSNKNDKPKAGLSSLAGYGSDESDTAE